MDFSEISIVVGGNLHLNKWCFDFHKDQGVNGLILHMPKALRVKQKRR